MAKPLYSAKLTNTQKNIIQTAETRLNEYYGTILSHWSEATREQQLAFIEGSPLLAWLLNWARKWEVKN